MRLLPKKASGKGPADRFTGDVWGDMIAEGDPPSRLRVGVVRFALCECDREYNSPQYELPQLTRRREVEIGTYEQIY